MVCVCVLGGGHFELSPPDCILDSFLYSRKMKYVHGAFKHVLFQLDIAQLSKNPQENPG